MPLRLTPQKREFFELFSRASGNARDIAGLARISVANYYSRNESPTACATMPTVLQSDSRADSSSA